MSLFRRLRSLFRKEELNQELSDELAFHLDKQIEQNMAAGMSVEEARYAALRSFGGVEQVKEDCREAWGVRFIDTLFHDLRSALRLLAKNPGFTAMAVLTLALGLAAVSTIFAVVETVLLRPLDYPHPERIFSISQALPSLIPGPTIVNLGEFRRWESSGLFEYAAAMDTDQYTLVGSGHPQRIEGVSVTANFFRVFGVEPFLGRGFATDDAKPGNHRVMVLTYALWKNSFGGDRGVVGKIVRLMDGPMTIIGVMPPRFDFPRLVDVRTIMSWAPEQPDFWTPLTNDQNPYNLGYYMLGRLRDGITPQRASQHFLASAIQIFRDEEVKVSPAQRGQAEQLIRSLAVNVVPLQDSMAWGIRDALWMLLAAVGLLLALVLFNLGNLVLTRNANRHREFVVREALGATRWQLFRQSFMEQFLLVTCAAGISLAVAEWSVSAIRSLAGARLPRLYALTIDLRVTALLALLSFLIAALFGALPLVVVRNSRLGASLQGEGRNLTADRVTNRLKSSLMVMQIAVSMVLLIAAGLFIQSFINVMRVKPGFDCHNVLNVTVTLDVKKNQDGPKRLAHFHEMLKAFRRIPGVEGAALASDVPLTGALGLDGVRAEGGPSNLTQEPAEFRVVDASYLRTMRIPLIAGRDFRDDEPATSAIVNHKMASRLWPGGDAMGKQFRTSDAPPLTIVGIVEDTHDISLESEPRMQFYRPLAAQTWFTEYFLIRTRINPEAILPAAQQAVWRLDSEAALSHPQTMERLLQSVTLDRRFETGLVAGFAGSALFLATLGLFSIAALSTARRTREFGVRRALGATGSDLVARELRRTLAIVVAGLGLGVPASLALARTVAGLLYGVAPWSPRVYTAAIAVLIVPAFVAAWIPARRAAKVDPMVALRYE